MRSTIAALVCSAGLGCIVDKSSEGVEGSETGAGDGDGDGDEAHLGEPLDHAAHCPDVEGPLLQSFIPARFGQLGPCGDMLSYSDPFGSNDPMLFPVDGEPEPLPPTNLTWYRLSPRGRVLLSHNQSDAVLGLRELGQAATQTFMLTEYAQSGFVISNVAPGTRVWICDDDTLDLIVDGERTTLANAVNCETLATSRMHSQLVLATLAQEVIWVDTDAGTLTPTSLAGFEYAESDAIGGRKDMLEFSESGPYVIHTTQEMIDNDGFPSPYPIDESLFDLGHDAMLIEHSQFYYVQAAVFGAPLFVVMNDELLGIRDGQLTSITTDVEPYTRPVAARDGSIVVIEAGGAVVRYGGAQFEIREVEVPSEPLNQDLMLSPDGQAGAVGGPTMLCATPACASNLYSLRQFSLAGPGPQLLSASAWQIAHVFDDGSVLADGSLVEGPFVEEVALPDAKLLLLGIDGQVRVEWAHSPGLAPIGAVLLADDRVVVGLAGWDLASELLVVDLDALTIDKIAEFEPFIDGIQWLDVDGLGQRIAAVLSGTAGLAWGEVP